MPDQHRRRGHFALHAIIAAPAVITRNRDIFPVTFDDIHLAARILVGPFEDNGSRGQVVGFEIRR
jgi:hypothetical protein